MKPIPIKYPNKNLYNKEICKIFKIKFNKKKRLKILQKLLSKVNHNQNPNWSNKKMLNNNKFKKLIIEKLKSLIITKKNRLKI